jgi:hypothetical protein
MDDLPLSLTKLAVQFCCKIVPSHSTWFRFGHHIAGAGKASSASICSVSSSFCALSRACAEQTADTRHSFQNSNMPHLLPFVMLLCHPQSSYFSGVSLYVALGVMSSKFLFVPGRSVR